MLAACGFADLLVSPVLCCGMNHQNAHWTVWKKYKTLLQNCCGVIEVNDLIDKQATIKRITEICCDGCDNCNGVRCHACKIDYATAVVDTMPAIEPKRGEWLDVDGGRARVEVEGSNIYPIDAHCSECGNWLVASDEYLVPGNYCPVCSADMRGDDNES